jgi:hypothetical protein
LPAPAISIGPLAVGDPAWRALVNDGIGATPFHQPDLVVAVGAATRRQSRGVGAWFGGELVGGVVTLMPVGGAPSPLSAAAYNGPVLAVPSAWAPQPTRQSARDRWSSTVIDGLLEAVVDIHPHAMLRMVPMAGDVRASIAAGWRYEPTFTFVLDIADTDRVWAGMDRNRRRLVRRAEELGYQITEEQVATDAAVAEVTRLHRNQQAGYGLSGEFDEPGWSVLLTRLLASGAGRLFMARTPAGEAVAFQLLTTMGSSAANLMTGTDAAHLPTGVNGLLRWEVCTVLSSEGLVQLDLNGAKPGESGRFKASFGGHLVERWDAMVPYNHRPRDLPRRVIAKARRTLLARRSSP